MKYSAALIFLFSVNACISQIDTAMHFQTFHCYDGVTKLDTVNTIYIHGRVIDKITKTGVEAADIIIKGTTLGAVTNKTGEFYIDVTDVSKTKDSYILETSLNKMYVINTSIKKKIKKIINVTIPLEITKPKPKKK